MIDQEKRRAYKKKYREEHREERREYDRKYREKHNDEITAARLRRKLEDGSGLQVSDKIGRLRTRYGISINDYESKLAVQNGLCSVCFNVMKVPHLDHNHTTGQIREFLCKYCNTGLGMFFENIKTLQSAIEYLKKHSATG